MMLTFRGGALPLAYKVLVLDDSPTVLRMTHLLLSRVGFEVVALDSAAHFFKILDKEKPDVVLVDVAMPVMDGGSVVEMSRKAQTHRCPVLLYSDRSERELQALAAQHGADGYVKKSSDPSALKTAILTAMVKGKTKLA
jgi:CheY-like chemotaxis protein